MAGVPNLNVVIQQGDVARNAQQMKSFHQDAQQVAASSVPDKVAKEKSQVQESPDSEKSKWEKQKEEQKRKRLMKKRKDREKKKNNKNNSDHILDTVV
ncbi:MAG: hypothetical protein ACQEQS_10330 [Thermodesulfobacteriota bacterium]